MITRQSIGEVIEYAATMLSRAERWRQLVESMGDDAAETKEALAVLRERFEPVWTQATVVWRAAHGHETYWEDLRGSEPRLARAAWDFSEAMKPAMKCLFLTRFEVIVPGKEGRSHADWYAMKWTTLDRVKDAYEKLRAAFHEGAPELYGSQQNRS